MNFFKMLNPGYYKEGSGVHKSPTNIQLFFTVLSNNFGKLFLLNLIFLISCIPIVTIPSAISAFMRINILLIRDSHCYIFSEYSQEFRSNMLKKIFVSLIVIIPPLSAYLWFKILNLSGYALGFAFTTSILTNTFGWYWFASNATVELSFITSLKNSLFLILVAWKSTLKLILLYIVTIIILISLFPYSILLVLFSFLSFLLVSIILYPILSDILIDTKQKT